MSSTAHRDGTLTAAIVLVLAVWLIAAPLVFRYEDQSYLAVANGIGVAAVLLTCASWILARLGGASIALGWIEAYCGLWLVLSPHVLRYPTPLPPGHNHLVVGLIVLVVSLMDTCLRSHRASDC
jgi:hypothetical protein